MNRSMLLIVCLICSFAAAVANADDVVFSTIDPNATTFTFGSGISYPILNHPAGSPPGVYQSYANLFSPTFTFTLSSISFAVRTIANNFGDLNAIIYPDDPSTNLPLTSAPLAMSAAVAPMGTGMAQTVPLTVFDFSGASLSLVAGEKYWIALEPGRDGTDVDWGFTTNNTRGRVAENTGSGYHQYTVGGFDQTPAFGAFQIRAVPEPSVTSFFVGSGVLICARKVTKRVRPNSRD